MVPRFLLRGSGGWHPSADKMALYLKANAVDGESQQTLTVIPALGCFLLQLIVRELWVATVTACFLELYCSFVHRCLPCILS